MKTSKKNEAVKRLYTLCQSVIVIALFSLFYVAAAQAKNQSQERKFDLLNEFIKKEAANKNLPLLSVILVNEDGIVWSGGVGKDTKNPNLVADSNMTYRIGSVSKLFTDIAVMQYVEKGILDLDAPVTTYLPDFKPDNPYNISITLRMLMSHSSGLMREPPVGNYFDSSSPSLTETVRSLNNTTLIYAPGSKVQYSNAAIAVVGRVLEKISGKSFALTLKENLLKPLGMKQSSFTPEDHVLANLPEAYMQSYQGERMVAPTFELGEAPAGSMYSSMSDLALFMGALIKKGEGVKGRFLKEKTLDYMWTPQTGITQSGLFGIGFVLGDLDGERTVSHNGGIYGFATQMKVLPDRKIGVAVSTNLDMAIGVANRIADHALRVLLAQQEGKAPPEYKATNPVSKNQAKKLAGLYKNGDETIRIDYRLGDLYIDRIGGMSLRLREQEGNIIIDDIMAYSDNIKFIDNEIKIFGIKYVKVFGLRYKAIADVKPSPINSAWSDLIGEYGDDHIILYISEKFDKLHALIGWKFEYPLIVLGDGVFKFPPYGLFPNEQLVFEKDDKGKIHSVNLNGIGFKRRSARGIENESFQITPVRPISVLEREALAAKPPEEKGRFKITDLVDITTYSDTIKLDIKYAGNDNFLGTPVYSSAKAFLQRPAAEALSRIAKTLEQQGYGLLVHDAYRPWYVTKIFWDATPEESKIFVADPSKGSRHNRGSAIDLTLYDLATGKTVEMVGLYDEMSQRSYPYYPGGTSLQRWHRELLRNTMESEGFKVYKYEWWHFDFDDWQNYQILNNSFETLK